MSIVTVAEARAYLRLPHDHEDVLLQALLDGAEEEAKRFTGRSQLPTLPQDYPPLIDSSGTVLPEVVPASNNLAPDVRIAIYLLVQSRFEALKPEDMARIRQAAEVLLMPYRVGLGL